MIIEESNRKKDDFSTFLARTFTIEKPWTLFTTVLLTFLFLSIKVLSFLCCVETCTWFTVVAEPHYNSLLIPNKPVFAGEISASLFISGRQTRETPNEKYLKHRRLRCFVE